MYRYIFALLVSISFLFTPTVIFAQTPTCTMVYGGGETQCQASTSANTVTPTPSTTSSASNAGQTTTKGGLPVYSPTPTTQTPPTGPEAIGLLGLIPAAAAGLWLRRKTK